jgi:arginase family enzyme
MPGFQRSTAVIDASSNLGLRPPGAGKEPGVRKPASTLRSRGIVSCLNALDGARGTPPTYSPDVDPETTVINGEAFALGQREYDPEARDVADTGIEVWDLSAVRKIGPGQAAARTIEILKANGVDGFWIHLDADVLDDEVMPAVDSRRPGGLSYAELAELLRMLLRSDLAVGMQVTVFDPEFDPPGEIAEGFTSAVVAAFIGEKRGV